MTETKESLDSVKAKFDRGLITAEEAFSKSISIIISCEPIFTSSPKLNELCEKTMQADMDLKRTILAATRDWQVAQEQAYIELSKFIENNFSKE